MRLFNLFRRIRLNLNTVAALSVIAASTTVIVRTHRASPAFGTRTQQPPSRSQPRPLPATPLSMSGLDTEGNPQARVALVEFTDFECPFCRSFAKTTLPIIRSEYVANGRAVLAVGQFPVRQIHPLAESAAAVGECASQAGKYWRYHDALFASADSFSASDIDVAAHSVGCSGAPRTIGQRTSDQVQLAKSLGVMATPSFFVGFVQSDGRMHVTDRLVGARPVDDFRRALDKALAAGAVQPAKAG